MGELGASLSMAGVLYMIPQFINNKRSRAYS